MDYDQHSEFFNFMLQSVREVLDLCFRGTDSHFHEGIDFLQARIKEEGKLDKKVREALGRELRHVSLKQVLSKTKVRDIVGARIGCLTLGHVYETVERLKAYFSAQNGWSIRPRSEQNYIMRPKESGYRSYHLEIMSKVPWRFARLVKVPEFPCEIQVRTLLQHAWAAWDRMYSYKNPLATDDVRETSMQIAEDCAKIDYKLDQVREAME